MKPWIIRYMALSGRMKFVRKSSGEIRTFDTKEKARQYIRNRPGFENPTIEPAEAWL